MPRVIHFEIAATDLPRAVSFNKTVFGWDLQKTKLPIEYWLATTGKPTEPGINGAIMPREGAPANIIITISVDSIEDTLKRIEANGGKGITPKAPHSRYWLFLLLPGSRRKYFRYSSTRP